MPIVACGDRMAPVTKAVAVAATGPLAVEAGLRVVREGGNAVDAAIAAMVVSMSTEPGIVSALGGAFVTIWPVDGEPEVVDGNVEMPGRGLTRERFGAGLREVRTSYGGGLTLYAGHGSVATPGAFAALGLAHARHGAGSWEAVLEPAASAARGGYPIGAAAGSYLELTAHSVFGWDPHTAPQVRRADGSAVRGGDVVSNVDLAETLDLIGRKGSDCVYTGEVGRAIAADMTARGGLVTQGDLTAYRAVVRSPIVRQVGEWTVATNPPPAVGGVMLAVMLGELATHGRLEWVDVINVQRRVLGYRAAVHDLSHDLEADGHALLERVQRYGLEGLPMSSNTANVSVVDSDGMACAITASSGYGSGATVPGTGMLLNNCLGEPELNRLGLHALAPGTRLASNMAPTAARTEDGRRLAIGSPGADRITTALLQVLSQGCLADADLQTAIDRPRLHVRILEDGGALVEYERDAGIAAAVVESGLPGREHDALSMFFGGVGAAYRTSGGSLQAAGDPRREAATGVG